MNIKWTLQVFKLINLRIVLLLKVTPNTKHVQNTARTVKYKILKFNRVISK